MLMLSMFEQMVNNEDVSCTVDDKAMAARLRAMTQKMGSSFDNEAWDLRKRSRDDLRFVKWSVC